MLLLLAAHALAGMMFTATLDAPVPTIPDLDLLPESGTWPCTLTLQVDGLGVVGSVAVAKGCPTGLVDTARELGKAWRWQPSAAPHAEDVTVLFTVLGFEDAEPKAVSTPDRVVYLLRPLGLLPVAAGAPAPLWKGKPARPKLPKAAVAAGISAGTCLVRIELAPDGTVAKARATRCVDALAEAAVAGAKKLRLEVAEGTTPPKELDLPVRFEAQDGP
ncbi:MAG: energy transducer TonB [Pseudomonadota bacterium]|nr:energy transducer TonB [Pseudomonadota bacterium]